MIIKTCYFVSRRDAIRYYRHYEDSTLAAKQAVSRKIESGEIKIGRPPCQPDESIWADSAEGRYYKKIHD